MNGWCFGGAFQPLAWCDFAIASEDATFELSEVNWGILPGGSVTRDIALLKGYRDALRYIITGKTFTAQEARDMGVVNEVVPRANLREAVMSLAAHLGTLNPVVMRSAKEAFKHAHDMNYASERARGSVKAKLLRTWVTLWPTRLRKRRVSDSLTPAPAEPVPCLCREPSALQQRTAMSETNVHREELRATPAGPFVGAGRVDLLRAGGA